VKTVFLRALEAEDKAEALLTAIREPASAQGKQRFEVDTKSFAGVPRSPFAYWVSERLRSLFKELPAFEAEGRSAKQGLATTADFRFVRTWWEIPDVTVGERWFNFAKGGVFSPFYADVHLNVNWEYQGSQIKAQIIQRYPYLNGNAGYVAKNTDRYFQAGLTWPLRTQSGLSMRAMPAGAVFGHKGPAAFGRTSDQTELLALLATANTAVYRCLVNLQMAFGSFEVGVIQRVPVPRFTTDDRNTLAGLSHHAWALKRALDTRTETSHAFRLPVLLQVEGERLVARAATWTEHVGLLEKELTAIQAQIDKRCFDLYGIDEADRGAITQGFGGTINAAAEDSEGEVDDDADTETSEAATADAATLTAELLSWAVGVAFGRFDIRLATGERAMPPEPEPFDPLPVCSPGMLTGEDGLLLNAPPTGYPIDFPTDGVLVDDAGHPRDLTARVRAVFEAVFGADADARWNEAAAMLDPKERNLRAWLAQTFFDQHLKRHSKSRRKAPIVWQIGTPSAEYSVWLYAHRLTKDSLFQIQNDLVGPKLALELRKQLGLAQAAGPNPSSSQRREIAAQEAFVEALRGMLDEVRRVAPLWAPDLNDGIVLTMAPLWRLVPQHKAWQKELKAAWEALCAGRYDWAHLAMHLWPERVVPKCATDRSLAIAHDLEDVFWAAGADGKWKPRATPTKTIEALVAERRSPAVKAALESLLEAPMSKTGGARGRRAAGENS
jgi:hypothetical protein